jgi:hypothetical protein
MMFILKLQSWKRESYILSNENVETSNCLYELSNHIDAVDARIDIVTVENFTNNV